MHIVTNLNYYRSTFPLFVAFFGQLIKSIISEATDAIEELISTTHIFEKSESRIERFVILMYDRTSYIT